MVSNAENKCLLIIPSVPVWRDDRRLYFDRKFHDGIISYCNSWNGTVQLIMHIAETKLPDFGVVMFNADVFPAELLLLKQEEFVSEKHLVDANVVLTSGDNFRNLHISKITKKLKIKCIYIIEYILETRYQIINMSDVSRWQKVKSLVWTVLIERKRRVAFRLAEGIQANGVPAYNAYKSLVSKNALLYFDSRNSVDTNITESELNTRLFMLNDNGPIRLGFSGRLIAMKGVDHLIDLACILRERNVAFTLDIFGAGELSLRLERKVKEYKLDELVTLRGNVDFIEELIPFIKSSLDLFVCCHRQSDPSCTYLETYACGVPIIGYDNKAHQGILEQADVGWSVAMNDVKALSEKVVDLSNNREEIKKKSINARLFSVNHTFEKTFSRRMEQCQRI